MCVYFFIINRKNTCINNTLTNYEKEILQNFDKIKVITRSLFDKIKGLSQANKNYKEKPFYTLNCLFLLFIQFIILQKL